MLGLTATALLRFRIGRVGDVQHFTLTNRVLASVTLVESFAGYDTVDLCSRRAVRVQASALGKGLNDVPVRMFWNANSTLLASRAEVSMKERLFSPVAKVSIS